MCNRFFSRLDTHLRVSVKCKEPLKSVGCISRNITKQNGMQCYFTERTRDYRGTVTNLIEY